MPVEPSRADTFDVAIVGLGPTGAVLANLLGEQGLDVAVIERSREVYPLPRAAHFDGETMRVFQSLGLMDRIEPFVRAGTQGMHFENAAGQTLLVRTGSEQPGPHGFANNWYFHQPDLERVLRAGLARWPNVRVWLGHAVRTVEPGEHDVLLTLEAAPPDEWDETPTGQAPDPAPPAIRARVVVGCDGARSLLRRCIGSAMDDLGLHQPWLCLDMIMEREVALPEYTVQLCDPARPMTMVNMAGRRRRWEIMLMPGDDHATIAEPASVWALLERWIRPGDARIERSAIYTFHSLIAKGWRRQRLLIAGDAAHQTPPFLGQGMCAGVRDAANLAWKLALVLKGGASETLLDTYESEREPHVREFIALAVRVGDVIQTTDPDIAAERDRRFAQTGPELFAFPQPVLGPGVHTGDGRHAGTLFSQPRLADGRLMDDAIGHRFALIVGDGLQTEAATRLATDARAYAIREDRVRMIDADAVGLAAALRERSTRAVLIRPDRYIVGTADDAESLETLLAALP